jgi:hypothetical protein
LPAPETDRAANGGSFRIRLRFVSSSDEKRLSLASSLARRHLLQQNQLKPLRGFAFLWT